MMQDFLFSVNNDYLFSVVFVSVLVEVVLLLQHDFLVPSADFSPEHDLALLALASADFDLQQALSLSHFFFFLSFFSSPLLIVITVFPAKATEDADAAPTIPVNAKRKNNFFML